MAGEPTLPLMGILKVPTLVVAAIAATGVVLSAMGFEIQTPGANLNEHIFNEHGRLDAAVESLTIKVDQNTHLMRALVIGYCIERERAELERAGLLLTCRTEGIEK